MLSSGSKLGAYEIVSPLGAGGMGEVYRARDTRLGRDVAVKVLPAVFSADSERLRRFEQEARAVAALNHPNILAVYDIGTHDGTPYLVTELLEGETLRERLRGGPLSVRKALDVAIQAAHGISAAHEKGIIHRDLKPANIFITNDGRVKILDFGLAKLTQRDASGLSETESPTRAASPITQTEAGVVLGTAGYMSPEQVRGKPADARSDIFALGTILYEMLSGQRAFEKDSSADTMAAILKEEPPELSGEGKKIPPAVERIVRHCLEKNAAERFQSARDLAFHLQSLSDLSTSATALVASKAPARRKRRLAFAAVGTVGLVLCSLVAYFLGRSGTKIAQPTFHQLTFGRGTIYGARFAPDAQTVYYSASWRGEPIQVYSTNPNSPESRGLNLSDATLLAVSPGEMAMALGCKQLLVAHCEGTLATVPISGGSPREIADNVVAADWAPNGQMAAIREVGRRFQVEFPLGKPIYQSIGWLDFLRVSPDGDMVAFADLELGSDVGRVVILDKTGKEVARSAVFPSVEGVVWAPTGNEVLFSATRNEAWANAIHALSPSGKERVLLRLPGILRLWDISRDGQVLLSKESWPTGLQFRAPKDINERDLSWLDSTIITDLSPDGAALAFEEAGSAARSGVYQSYLRKTDGSAPAELGQENLPVLSPDGKWVLAGNFPFSKFDLLPTGAGQTRELDANGMKEATSLGWMPDGKEIYFAGNDGHEWRIYVERISGGTPQPITPPISVKVEYIESDLISPDGKFVFARDLSGKGWLYRLDRAEPQAVPGLTPGDIWTNWTADGRSAYIYQDKKTLTELYRLDLTTGKRTLVRTLAPSDSAGLTDVRPVRITPDGKTYAYSYDRALSELYLVEGVK
ncbi:MAG TPA: protein kinase [Candidatus Acidoferrales bacterium]|nr:protein kinase [Candidatus Acidoferrales bacterium]